jgi:hypothetical protein
MDGTPIVSGQTSIRDRRLRNTGPTQTLCVLRVFRSNLTRNLEIRAFCIALYLSPNPAAFQLRSNRFRFSDEVRAMNGLTAASPRRPRSRGAGASDGHRTPPNAFRGRRGRGGNAFGSKLASSTPITSADLSPASFNSLTNGDGSASDSDAAYDSDTPSRLERFNNTDPGNQYEQVRFLQPLCASEADSSIA